MQIDCNKNHRDQFSIQYSPFELEFGHISETPLSWEERYERQDLANQRHQGKVCPLIS